MGVPWQRKNISGVPRWQKGWRALNYIMQFEMAEEWRRFILVKSVQFRYMHCSVFAVHWSVYSIWNWVLRTSQVRQNVFGFQFPLKEDTSTNTFDNNLNKPCWFNNATNRSSALEYGRFSWFYFKALPARLYSWRNCEHICNEGAVGELMAVG